MSDNQWYYRTGAKQCGPVTWEVISELLKTKQLAPEDEIYDEEWGTNHWVQVQDFWIRFRSPEDLSEEERIWAEEENDPSPEQAKKEHDWYYMKGEETCGPVTWSEIACLLATDELSQSDLIRRNDFTQWIAVKDFWINFQNPAERELAIQGKLDFYPPPIGGYEFFPTASDLATKEADARWFEKPSRILTGHQGGVSCLAFAPNHPWVLVSGSFDKTVRLWDISTSTILLSPLVGHADTISAVAFSPTEDDEMLLASSSWDGTIRVWNLNRLFENYDEQETLDAEFVSDVLNHSSPVNSLAFLSESVLLSGTEEGYLHFWDVYVNEPCRQIPTISSIQGMCVTPDRKTIVTTHKPRFVCSWDADSGTEIDPEHRWARRIERCHIISCSPSGDIFAVIGNTASMGEASLATKTQEINWLGFVSLPSFVTGKERRFRAHNARGYSIAFSPDAQFVATASADGTARLWEVESEKLIAVLQGHKGEVFDVAFSPDGGHLVSGGSDGVIAVWNLAEILTQDEQPHSTI